MSANDKTISDARTKLAEARHGGHVLEALKTLAPLASAGDYDARSIIAEYASNGAIPHMRAHATSQLARMAGPSTPELRELFTRLIGDDVTRYWAIDGLLKYGGMSSYPRIVEIALDAKIPLEQRSKAVKELAKASGQLFDRELPRDPGHWKTPDLRCDDVIAWASAGYPAGPGYPPPPRDPALDNPKSPFEKLMARLDAKLTACRRRDDPADPHNYLVPSDPSQTAVIVSRWELPRTYEQFLERFSPCKVNISDRERFYNGGLNLYGVPELVARQVGYANDPHGTPFPGWPKGYLVIADHAGDPFVMDLSSASEGDARILAAEHGAGKWEFEPVARSFYEFLESLL